MVFNKAIRNLNNTSGVLHITSSRNHTAPELFQLLDWIVENALGSYGIIYVLDDESEYSNEFRVIKINKGNYTFHNDPFLSPIYPEVEYEL
ncbi:MULTISPECIES: Imm7 family immunity protein [Pirellulaceae]|uniref:Imm7 family immunity protein n=1 Tax=Pirellulaceae TaxID=2691357 RepID=UPI0013047F5F